MVSAMRSNALSLTAGQTNGGKNDRGAWSSAPLHHQDVWAKLEPTFQAIVDKYPKLNHVQRTNHLGTLGTGNHFIEVCLDEEDKVWFLLHSGSRGVGNRFGTFFIELAKKDMRQWMINLPDQDLAYLPQGTEHFNDYVRAVHWAQDYALANRELMMQNIVAAVGHSDQVPPFQANVAVVSCHHNYVTWKTTTAKTCSSPARVPCVLGKAIWALFPAAWERVRTLCAARAIPRAS